MDLDQVKAEISVVLKAIARGDQRYRYNSPFMREMVRWDAVQEDLDAILDRYATPIQRNPDKQEGLVKNDLR